MDRSARRALCRGRAVATVATGNDGEADADLKLNRIQPPSDGVNVLSIGSATSMDRNGGAVTIAALAPEGLLVR